MKGPVGIKSRFNFLHRIGALGRGRFFDFFGLIRTVHPFGIQLRFFVQKFRGIQRRRVAKIRLTPSSATTFFCPLGQPYLYLRIIPPHFGVEFFVHHAARLVADRWKSVVLLGDFCKCLTPRRLHGLHRALPKSAFTHHHRPAMGLQCTRDDLARAG